MVIVVENFTRRVLQSRILNIYVAMAFFATTIFFVLNPDNYTVLEVIFAVIIVTIAFKSFANLMFAMSVAFVNLDNTEDSIEFEKSSSKLDSLVNDLAIKEASVQAAKNDTLQTKK